MHIKYRERANILILTLTRKQKKKKKLTIKCYWNKTIITGVAKMINYKRKQTKKIYKLIVTSGTGHEENHALRLHNRVCVCVNMLTLRRLCIIYKKGDFSVFFFSFLFVEYRIFFSSLISFQHCSHNLNPTKAYILGNSISNGVQCISNVSISIEVAAEC